MPAAIYRAFTYRFRDFRLLPAARELWRGDARIALPPRVLACLCHLIEHRDRAVGREELIRAVWRHDNVSDIQLGQLILRTRRAVSDEGNAQHSIRTVVGFGYRWIAPTEVDAVSTSTTAATEDAAIAPAEPLAATTRPPRPVFPSVAPFGASIAVGLLLLLAAAFVWHERSAPSPRPPASVAIGARVAVLPIDVDAADDAAWLRLGGMDLIADRLRRSGMVVARSEAILALLGTQAPADPAQSLQRLQRGVGTTLLIEGSLVRAGDTWTMRLHARMAGGVAAVAAASGSDAVATLREAGDRLLAALGRAPMSGDTSPATEYVQRARAALLSDEPARAREILSGAPVSLRGDPELRFYLAQSDVRAGRFADADAALGALLGEVSAADNPRLRLRILNARGLARIRIGRLQEARQDFAAASALPHAEEFVGELGEAYNGRAIADIALHDFDAGNGDLGRARVQLERAGDALGVARVDANLGLLDYERGALAQAEAHLRGAILRFEAFASTRELASASSGLLLVQLAQLQNSAALATSARLWDGVEHTGDPIQKRALVLRRAGALLATGALGAARALLDDISANPGPNLVETRDDERLHLLRTELALREGRAADAAREAAALPEAPPTMGDDDLRAYSALLRGRALPQAVPPASAPQALALGDATPAAAPLRALLDAERALRAGARDVAEQRFRKALSLAESGGVPRVIASVAAAYVPFLLSEHRLDEAAALTGRVAVWADDDFDCALLQLQLASARGDPGAWARARARLIEVAGERAVPPELNTPPAAALR
ncbi:MAG: winged helix-turn-helix domain-containing protein [Dokdonella sp.]